MEITWVYYGFSWDPEDKSIAGSEQAVVHLSEHWVQKGYKVVVYSLVPTKVVNGVSYKWIECFDTEGSYEILILCREGTLNILKDRRPKAKLVLSDLQDDTQTYKHMEFISYVDRFMFKSNYHVSCYKHLSLPEDKYFICPNGLQLQNFTPSTEQRDPLRFCYTSSYDRGLEQLLEWSWPKIHKEFPTSTLHVYYGWAPWHETEQRNRIEKLMEQSGVIHHGRVSNAEVISEKYKSSMHLYPCHHPTEIDCINIRESVLAECIPVLSDQNVCPERDGFMLLETQKKNHFMTCMRKRSLT